LKFLLARQAAVVAALALFPAAGEAVYFRDKISWRSAIAPSEMVTVEQARGWGDSAIWVDARPDDEFANDHVPGAISLNEDRWNELLPQFLAVWVPGKKIASTATPAGKWLGACARKRSSPTCSCSKAAGKRG